MVKIISSIILGLLVIACPILYFTVGPALTPLQKETGLLLLYITGGSALYCFVVGEITHNNSQMDKLWSLLPIAYAWVVAAKGDMAPRLVIIAILVTLWGIRLTFNFARKGAYSIKFWTGEEDYRWEILREKEIFKPRYKWTLFNLFFISIYQNIVVLLICIPALSALGSLEPLNWIDYLATGLAAFFLIIELIADEQQYAFQSKKWKLLKEGKKLEELPFPYNKGFNTNGLWNYARHPNYLGEQMFWLCIYIFSIAAKRGLFNWSIIGALLLILIFVGSSSLAEKISSSKYPEYKEYQKRVSCFIPWKPYR